MPEPQEVALYGRVSRRLFLRSLVGSSLVVACGSSDSPSPGGATDGCADLAGAERLGRVRFLDEGAQVLDVGVGDGLDGRLYTDLGRLTPETLVIPNDRFYVRTNKPDRVDYGPPWKIRVRGLVAAEVDLTLADLSAQEMPIGPTLLECSGNARGGSFGLIGVARWSGAPLARILDTLGAAGAPRVLVSGFDDHSQPSERSVPGASWIFTREEIAQTGAFLATTMNGGALPEDHGFPVRLVVPGWYGCTCIKWVNEIRLVGEDEPSTEHMREFASRTHQDGTPALARDFLPARIDLAAVPIRIERIRLRKEGVSGVRERLLFTGIFWGGEGASAELDLRVGALPPQRAQICAARESPLTWGLWSAVIDMPPAGTYDVTLRAVDAQVRTRRLDTGFYARSFTVA